jgi:hypothetical protein
MGNAKLYCNIHKRENGCHCCPNRYLCEDSDFIGSKEQQIETAVHDMLISERGWAEDDYVKNGFIITANNDGNPRNGYLWCMTFRVSENETDIATVEVQWDMAMHDNDCERYYYAPYEIEQYDVSAWYRDDIMPLSDTIWDRDSFAHVGVSPPEGYAVIYQYSPYDDGHGIYFDNWDIPYSVIVTMEENHDKVS